MKECPRCGLLNPDTASKCDCGNNFDNIDPRNLNFWEQNKRGGIFNAWTVISIVILLFIISSLIYRFDYRDFFAEQFMRLFDTLHIDPFLGIFIICIIALFLLRNNFKNWNSISTIRKFDIILLILFTVSILVVFIFLD